jgi:hypothetical protein
MRKIGASEADILRVEAEIAESPTAGDVVPGLGGIRKIRFRLGNQGKRGAGRAIYFLVVAEALAVLLFA